MKFNIERLEQKNQPAVGTGTAIGLAISAFAAGYPIGKDLVS